MTTIHTSAELDALPVGSVIQWPNDCGEFYTLERWNRGWLMPGRRDPQDATDYLPAFILYRPDQQPAVSVETAMAYDLGVRDGECQRPTAQPRVEQVASTFAAHRTVDRDEEFGGVPVCAECGWKPTPDFTINHHAASAVLTLLPGRPEWVIKAEGVREAKDSIVELIALSDPDAPFSVSIESVLGLIADRIEADR